MTKKKIAETASLLAATGLLIAIPPSDQSPIAFVPVGLMSTALFFVSRLLRHGTSGGVTWIFILVETGAFFLIAGLVNASANILLKTL